ncbi:hypothetical protein PACTADRAFT_81887 [Pachysolen tannophilus NRRL Y-2460]|uniref:Uncharacterized protein n=1 Tax=Pachysolen tannophilus NRRL Y-2460 TaxID=669874 RepID=A0A1E4TRB0_PACTA|nr:hypothetical protein PACTADRAFT_81887 [Pachysolen tannophilus NRRL Y-2460]
MSQKVHFEKILSFYDNSTTNNNNGGSNSNNKSNGLQFPIQNVQFPVNENELIEQYNENKSTSKYSKSSPNSAYQRFETPGSFKAYDLNRFSSVKSAGSAKSGKSGNVHPSSASASKFQISSGGNNINNNIIISNNNNNINNSTSNINSNITPYTNVVMTKRDLNRQQSLNHMRNNSSIPVDVNTNLLQQRFDHTDEMENFSDNELQDIKNEIKLNKARSKENEESSSSRSSSHNQSVIEQSSSAIPLAISALYAIDSSEDIVAIPGHYLHSSYQTDDHDGLHMNSLQENDVASTSTVKVNYPPQGGKLAANDTLLDLSTIEPSKNYSAPPFFDCIELSGNTQQDDEATLFTILDFELSVKPCIKSTDSWWLKKLHRIFNFGEMSSAEIIEKYPWAKFVHYDEDSVEGSYYLTDNNSQIRENYDMVPDFEPIKVKRRLNSPYEFIPSDDLIGTVGTTNIQSEALDMNEHLESIEMSRFS